MAPSNRSPVKSFQALNPRGPEPQPQGHGRQSTNACASGLPLLGHRGATCGASVAPVVAPRVWRRSASRTAFAAPVGSPLAFKLLPRRSLLGGRRPPRAYGQVRAHLVPGELRTATPTVSRPCPRRNAALSGSPSVALRSANLRAIAAGGASALGLKVRPSAVYVCWWYTCG